MEALKWVSPSRVTELNDRAAFILLKNEWDALVGRTGDQLFYRHDFLRIWIDNFTPRAKLRVLLARDDEGRLTAALPLLEERVLMYGLPVRQLLAAANP